MTTITAEEIIGRQLEHHGVLGMRWGVSRAAGRAVKTTGKVGVTTAATKGVLAAHNSKGIVFSEHHKAAGKAYMKGVLKNAGDQQVKRLANKAAAKATDAAVNAMIKRVMG